MKRHINFGSIEQFRNVIKKIQHTTRFVGLDEDGNAIYDNSRKLPTIKAIASEKIHGTNGAVCYHPVEGFWVQSRTNIITPEKDNAGCATSAIENQRFWLEIINSLIKEYEISSDKIVSVYFEWCGGNIQKNSAVSGLDKRAIIFQHFKVSDIDPEGESSYWLETKVDGKWIDSPQANIFNVMNFPYYELTIDFENPHLTQNQLVELVDKVEENSPVGRAFGIDGNIGEGIVVSFMYDNTLHKFKCKGEKHSKSKVKTLKPVDAEKEQAKIDFANYATPVWRLEQAVENVCDTLNGGVPDIKDLGKIIKWVMSDIVKEESDVLVEKGLSVKEISSYVNGVVRDWYIALLDEKVGL